MRAGSEEQCGGRTRLEGVLCFVGPIFVSSSSLLCSSPSPPPSLLCHLAFIHLYSPPSSTSSHSLTPRPFPFLHSTPRLALPTTLITAPPQLLSLPPPPTTGTSSSSCETRLGGSSASDQDVIAHPPWTSRKPFPNHPQGRSLVNGPPNAHLAHLARLANNGGRHAGRGVACWGGARCLLRLLRLLRLLQCRPPEPPEPLMPLERDQRPMARRRKRRV